MEKKSGLEQFLDHIQSQAFLSKVERLSSETKQTMAEMRGDENRTIDVLEEDRISKRTKES